jgi:hypothetical protein
MLKYLLFSLLTVSLLGGCSSTQQVVETEKPYCTTKQQIVTQDGTVSSKTVVDCSDDEEERYFKMVEGISSHCGKVAVWPTINGKPTKRYAYACQMLDGTYRYVTSPY